MTKKSLRRPSMLTAAAGAGALMAPLVLAGPAATAAPATGRLPVTAQNALSDVVPAPVSVDPDPDATFQLTPHTLVRVQRGSQAAQAVGEQLAALLRRSTGYRLPVVPTSGPGEHGGRALTGISLLLTDPDPQTGPQGYELQVEDRSVVVRASTGDGLFNGVQTLRQLLPAAVESDDVQPGPWTVPGGTITDSPRFAYRGAMLDVARHFFTVEEVKKYVDEISAFKVNRLHLHLSDDQGWRIEIPGWPRLTEVGSTTEVGGGPGGFYTQEDYAEIVAYAAARHVTVIPEIDMPGHVNAALASYAELSCDGVAPPLYTGIEVGFSSFCVDKEITYEFIGDVLRTLAAMTPGPYLHIGGDEAHSTTEEDYATFMGRVLPIVQSTGKTVMGWQEVLHVAEGPGVVGQYWVPGEPPEGVLPSLERGNRLVMSPADHAYIDMKYDEDTPLGLSWAGYTSVEDSYDWDPATYAEGITDEDVLGVEAPLWSETLEDIDDIEYMAFPRLPAIAEIGWTPRADRSWDSLRERLAGLGERWDLQGVDFYRSPEIDWED